MYRIRTVDTRLPNSQLGSVLLSAAVTQGVTPSIGGRYCGCITQAPTHRALAPVPACTLGGGTEKLCEHLDQHIRCGKHPPRSAIV